jgi:hypothetical protein
MNCIAESDKYQIYTYMGSNTLQSTNTIDRSSDGHFIAGLREHRMSFGLPNFLQEFKDSKPLSLAEKKQVVQQTLQMCEAMLRKPALVHTDMWAENFVIRSRDEHGINVGLVDYGMVQDCTNIATCKRQHFFDNNIEILASSDMLRFVVSQIFIPLVLQDPWTTLFRKLVEERAGPLIADDWSSQNRRALSWYKMLCTMLLGISGLPRGIEETPDLRDPDGELWHEAYAFMTSPQMAHPLPSQYFGTVLGTEVPYANMPPSEEPSRLGLDEHAVLHEIVPNLHAPSGYWTILHTLLLTINMGIGNFPPSTAELELIFERQHSAIDCLLKSSFFS